MNENIEGYNFDLSKPIKLETSSAKFWQITLNNDNNSLKFKVGKIKDGFEFTTEEIEKVYENSKQVRQTLIKKIEDKLRKGYFSKELINMKDQNNNNKQTLKKNPQKTSKNLRLFSGEYYEKGLDAVKIQLNGSKVKITRIDQKKQEKFQIRNFDTNDKAVQFCLQEQQWHISQGYNANSSKFLYSFIDNNQQKQGGSSSSKKKKSPENNNKNFLSITRMTDDAISHRSRNISTTKSDRSYYGDDGSDTGRYVDTKLGPPTHSFIKVLLAQTWKDNIDPVGWLMSQKLDGVRCFWTGSKMYSRNGNQFFFPKFFTKNWPKSQLDGQLFIGRGKFSQTLSAVKKNNPIDSQWQKVRYLVFDCPGLKLIFKKRIKMMEQVINSIDNIYIKCHGHRQCKGFPDLFQELDSVNKIQGQGLMLRNPDSFYQNRRSNSLLKVKTFHDDQATILGYTKGTGRCLGMVGALRVVNTHGIEFQVGSGLNDELRRKPPKLGTKITYKYQQFNKDSGKPRFPTYLRAFDDKI